MSTIHSSHTELSFYKHSGQVPIGAIAAMLSVGLLGSAVCGMVYAVIVWYLPFIYINFLLTIGMGTAAGWIVGKLGRKLHTRNNMAMLAIGGLSGIVAWYAAWVAWIFAVSEYNALIILPWDIQSVMVALGENGVWNLKDWTPTGWTLYAFWAIEFLMITLIAAGYALSIIDGSVYCENCRQWIGKDCDSPALARVENKDNLKASLLGQDYTALLNIWNKPDNPDEKSEPDGTGEFTLANITTCPSCQENCYLSVDNVTVKVDKDGKLDTNSTNLLKHAIIPAETFVDLKANWQLMSEELEQKNSQAEAEQLNQPQPASEDEPDEAAPSVS